MMVLAAANLAECATTEIQKRALARYCFLYADEALLWLQRWKNEVKRTEPGSRHFRSANKAVRSFRDVLSTSSGVRDFLVAKRQPAADIRGADMQATLLLWLAVNPKNVRNIVQTAVAAVDCLDQRHDNSSIALFVETPASLDAAIRERTSAKDHTHWYVAADTSAELREFTLPVAQGGLIGQRIAQINDIATHLDVLRQIAPLVEQSMALDWLIKSAMVTELSALLDLSLGPPPGLRRQNHFALLELLRGSSMSYAVEELEWLRSSIGAEGWRYIRSARNNFGAHADGAMSVFQIHEHLVHLDYQGTIRMAEIVMDCLDRVGAGQIGLNLLLFGERRIGTWPIDPEARAPGRPSNSMVPGRLAEFFRRVDSHLVIASPSSLGSSVIAGITAGRKPEPRKTVSVRGHPPRPWDRPYANNDILP